MKNLGQMTINNVFIKGTEHKSGTTKAGKPYDFTLVRFDDETGEGFELRLDEGVENGFPRRSEGDLLVNVYHGKGWQGGDSTYLKVAGFTKYED